MLYTRTAAAAAAGWLLMLAKEWAGVMAREPLWLSQVGARASAHISRNASTLRREELEEADEGRLLAMLPAPRGVGAASA